MGREIAAELNAAVRACHGLQNPLRAAPWVLKSFCRPPGAVARRAHSTGGARSLRRAHQLHSALAQAGAHALLNALS